MDFSEYIGMTTGQGTVVVERAPVSLFATAVTDPSAVYQNAEVAEAEGFDGIPAPPTFGFTIQNSGRWEERQPPVDRSVPHPLAEVMGALMSGGGIILHGEQEFTYHRPIVVGQVLNYTGKVRDIYQKTSGERTMTFVVVDDTYTDEEGREVLTSTMNLLHRA